MKFFKAPCFFIGLAILLSVFAVVIWIAGSREIKNSAQTGDDPGVESPSDPLATDEGGPDSKPLNPGSTPQDLGFKLESEDPQQVVNNIVKILSQKGVDGFSEILGSDAMDDKTKEQLALLAQKHAGLKAPIIREVGELEFNKRTRWALEFLNEEGKRDRIYLDLKKDGDKWTVEKVTVPSGPDDVLTDDALGAAEAFLQAVLSQEFEESRKFVDSKSVSNARIAGLCIIFEEGNYQMRKNKPLRAMFQREGVVGYVANVEDSSGGEAAQFSLIVNQVKGAENWVVSEINLDQLLADYAERVAGGDVFYSPFVRNPAGGDTLALYFEFDEDEINPRTRRQLDIVARLLKTDDTKKLTLSGHTDSKGTDQYNVGLSERRADVVKDYLLNAGVKVEQIVILAKGSSQPRRPNVTEEGEDNPDGRRANRRTEIYLDF